MLILSVLYHIIGMLQTKRTVLEDILEVNFYLRKFFISACAAESLINTGARAHRAPSFAF